MPEQCRSNLDADPEVLQTCGEGMAEVVKVEILHLSPITESAKVDGQGLRSPSAKDLIVKTGHVFFQGVQCDPVKGHLPRSPFQPTPRGRKDQPCPVIPQLDPGRANIEQLGFPKARLQGHQDNPPQFGRRDLPKGLQLFIGRDAFTIGDVRQLTRFKRFLSSLSKSTARLRIRMRTFHSRRMVHGAAFASNRAAM